MKFLPEMCFEPRNNRLDFRDDPDCNLDPDFSHICMKLLSEVFL